LSSIICNKPLIKSADIDIPEISKKDSKNIVKLFLKHIDTDIIKFFLEKNVLLSEIRYNPVKTISFYDEDQTIRATYLDSDILE
jgi:hypothetical protein